MAGWITPVPGGVGPMTVAMLLKNTLLCAKKIMLGNTVCIIICVVCIIVVHLSMCKCHFCCVYCVVSGVVWSLGNHGWYSMIFSQM